MISQPLLLEFDCGRTFFTRFGIGSAAAAPAPAAMASVAAAAASASASSLLLGKRSSFACRFGCSNGVVASGAALTGLNLLKASSSQKRRSAVVAAADNVEQKQTEQQEQDVLKDALLDTSLEIEDPQKPLKTRQGLEERFAVINTGAFECRSCGHVYEEVKGDSSYPVAAGTMFRDLPEDWLCPTCGAAKTYYQSKSVEVAGFAQNQQYGLGGNTLTAGQKSILIYGSLLFFFALFLSGYFLQ